MNRRITWIAALIALALVSGAISPSAKADGDPGSDVLVYQPLFLTSASGVSVPQQVRLGGLLQQANRSGFPVRVAIIANRSDLGAVTELWGKPRAYARFLSLELSLAYSGRLVVVMPNGLGFNWPGHSSAAAYRTLSHVQIPTGAGGLATAAETAVRGLAAASGVTLRAAAATPNSTAPPARATNRGSHTTDLIATLSALAAAAAAAVVIVLRRRRGPRRATPDRLGSMARRAAHTRSLRLGIPLVALGALGVLVAINVAGSPSPANSDALAGNPVLDPGTKLSGPAPDFTLTDQFGRSTSLRAFRGKVVILAFNDSECTTVCPLTTTSMLDAKAMLGSAGSQVQLLGIDANPEATAVQDVLSYSELHGLQHQWRFLTGSLPQLKQTWKRYSIGVSITQRQVDHSPAVFIIDPQGRLAKLYVTQQSYAAVGQFAQLLAQQASALLPSHPQVHSDISYRHIGGVSPTTPITVPKAGGGSVQLGPGQPRLLLFFATWNRQTTGLAGQLQALNAYQSAASAQRLPRLTAVDEASVEPSPTALPAFMAELPKPLDYPVAVDRSGRLADGYEVQGQPWFVLTSGSGRILWYWQVSTSNWPSPSGLIRQVRNALAHAPRTAPNQQALAGSPAPLAALHTQAGRLLGGQGRLAARIKALHGYPIVLNAWASWCTPCKSEFGLLASASARYGRKVAFLGADTDDSSGDAQAFLGQHPVSYPSYQDTTAGLHSVVPQGVLGLPTTVFIDRAGKVSYVHTGQYDSQGTLDGEIAAYALGR